METFQLVFDIVVIIFAITQYYLWDDFDRDIHILYLRTDKKTKEIEKERQYRTQINRRLKQVEHVLRGRNKVRQKESNTAKGA